MRTMIKRLPSLLSTFLGAALPLLPAVALSGTLAHYTFPYTSSAESGWISSAAGQPGITVSPVSPGQVPEEGKIEIGGGGNLYYEFPESLGEFDKEKAIAANYYIEFVVEPNAGNTVSYSTLRFSYGGTKASSGTTYQANFFVRTSSDGYSSDLASINYTVEGDTAEGVVLLPDGGMGSVTPELFTLDLTGVSNLQEVGEALTIRIYAFTDQFLNGAPKVDARPRLDDIVLEGTVK